MIRVRRFAIEKSSEKLGSLTLRRFQAGVIHSNSPVIVLSTPTGSGKTLAYLAKAVREKYYCTIIVYPTNALINDQANSIKRLLGDLGKKCVQRTPRPDEVSGPDEVSDGESADFSLYVVNGEALNALAGEMQMAEGTAWLNVLRGDCSPQKIFLTNPEVLYFLFLQKFAKNKDLFDSILGVDAQQGHRRLLVLDEFHLYYGYSLSTLFFMLSYIKPNFEHIIFSSATPTSLPSFFGGFETIEASQASDGDVVQYELEFDFRGARGFTLGREDIPDLCELVKDSYDGLCWKKGRADVVVIVNSVITAYWLARELEKIYPDGVSEIHGLVPQGERSNPEKLKPIVVGTSAIEVGMDFDAGCLIFEASNVESFIQRLGRGGRHAPCRVTAIIPGIHCEEFRKQIGSGPEISREELLCAASKALPRLPVYSEFLETKGADIVLASILTAWQLSVDGRLNMELCRESLLESLESDDWILPGPLKERRERLKDVINDVNLGGLIRALAENMSVRSTLTSLPAYFDLSDHHGYDFVALEDLSKVEFEVRDLCEVREVAKKRGDGLPLRFKNCSQIVVIKRILDKSREACISLKKDDYNEPRSLGKFTVVSGGDTGVYKQLLRGQPAYLVDEKSDWRILGMRVCGDGFLVLGGDALVARYCGGGL